MEHRRTLRRDRKAHYLRLSRQQFECHGVEGGDRYTLWLNVDGGIWP